MLGNGFFNIIPTDLFGTTPPSTFQTRPVPAPTSRPLTAPASRPLPVPTARPFIPQRSVPRPTIPLRSVLRPTIAPAFKQQQTVEDKTPILRSAFVRLWSDFDENLFECYYH